MSKYGEFSREVAEEQRGEQSLTADYTDGHGWERDGDVAGTRGRSESARISRRDVLNGKGIGAVGSLLEIAVRFLW